MKTREACRLAGAEESGLSQGRTPEDSKVRSGSIKGFPTEDDSTGMLIGDACGSKSSSNQFSGSVRATTLGPQDSCYQAH